jgi:hypothetical protein
VQHLLEPQVHQLGEAAGAIGVEVVDGQPATVLIDQHEGWAGHVGGDAEPAREAEGLREDDELELVAFSR